MLFHCSRKTKYYDGEKEIKRDVIKAGDQVSVDGRRAPDASLDAVIVRVEHPKPPEEEKPSDQVARAFSLWKTMAAPLQALSRTQISALWDSTHSLGRCTGLVSASPAPR